MTGSPAGHAALMDGVYRHQRHVYDLTRKYYLLGRDRLIEGLDVPDGGSVLEIGCGTGRNLALAAKRYPHAQLFGADISAEMLKTAERNLTRAGVGDRVRLGRADATEFTRDNPFGQNRFDRVFISYAISMIPGWRMALAEAAAALAPGGSLHVVDFGQQEGLPRWFRVGLHGWLARFHVAPRADLKEVLGDLAASDGYALTFKTLYRGYAWHGVVTHER